MAQSNIGLIGLGVMGQNLSLNIERNGYSVAVYDRESPVLKAFSAKHPGKKLFGAESPEQFVAALEKPRKIILLIKAGDPVDWTINLIKPFLEAGDILIDGGNSYFRDTERREKELQASGMFMIGSGTSGGEKGALNGPSLMPGGDHNAYEQIRPIWEAIAAKVPDGPCVTYIGPGGSGHFVKMIHNGIEYGDMQLIAEAYWILRHVLKLEANELAEIFEEWNRGELESYLIEITAEILRVKDPDTGRPLLDLVLDKAGQKGTGKWASQIALDLGIAIPTIDAAIEARNISAQKKERVTAAEQFTAPPAQSFGTDRQATIDAVRGALYASKICSYAQGMNVIKAASDEYGWNINLSEIARIWQGGCIIRAKFLGLIKNAYLQKPDLVNLLLDEGFKSRIDEAQNSWRAIAAHSIQMGLPIPAFAASISYFDLYRSAELPLNLTQAQRDFFGSHTYERIDRPDAGFIHSEWEQLLAGQSGKSAS